jgi:hypothetical protein
MPTADLAVTEANDVSTEGDPYFSNVVMLVPFDGTSGSTYITDRSPLYAGFSNGGVIISNAQSKFGGTSGYCPANGWLKATPYNALYQIERGDFTVEAWVYNAGPTSSNQSIVSRVDVSGNGLDFQLLATYEGSFVRYHVYIDQQQVAQSMGNYATNFWQYVSVVQHNGQITLQVDGYIQYPQNTPTYYHTMGTAPFTIGGAWDSGGGYGGYAYYYFNGFLDDVRITRGVARYNGYYVPSIAPACPTYGSSVASIILGTTASITESPDTLTAAASAVSFISGNLAVTEAADVSTTGDTYFNRVILLVPMDGANGGTTFLDKSPIASALSRVNATTSTSNIKYGTASGMFLHNAHVETGTNSAYQFAGGDFTVELWAWISLSVGTAGSLINIYDADASAYDFEIRYLSSGTAISLQASSGPNYAQTAYNLSENVWYHIAFVRSGSALTLYVNGTNVGAGTYTYPVTLSNRPFDMGSRYYSGSGGYYDYFLNGYLDDVRVTKGVARYTSNFTAPTAAFPVVGISFAGITDGFSASITEAADTLSGAAVVITPQFCTLAVTEAPDTGSGSVAITAGPVYEAPDYVEDPYWSNTVLAMHMDGANNGVIFKDSSTYNHIAVPTGTIVTSTAQFKFGSASLLLNGTDSQLWIADGAEFEFGSGAFTIETWFYLTGYATVHSGVYQCALITKEVSGSREFRVCLDGTASSFDALAVYLFDAGGAVSDCSAATSFSLNTWYHVAVTRSGNTVYVFKNGAMVSTTTVTIAIPDTTASVYIGFNYFAPLYPAYFKGYIDDLRVTKGVARYVGNFTLPTDTFVASAGTASITGYPYCFADANITEAADTMPNDSNTLSLLHFDGANGSTTYTDAVSGITWVSTSFNSAPNLATDIVKFGTAAWKLNARVTLGALISTNAAYAVHAADFTVEFWLYPQASGDSYRALFNWGTTGAFFCQINNLYQIGLSAIGGVVSINSSPVTLDTWHHIAITKSGTSFILYVDGVNSASGTGTLDVASTQIALAGSVATDVATLQQARIDEFRISNTVRYTSNFTPPTAAFAYRSGYATVANVVTCTAAITEAADTLSTIAYYDPAWTNVGLLLHCDGSNLSTTITDSSPTPKTVTAVSGAKLSTAQVKFGTASLLLNGTTDYITVPSNAAFQFKNRNFTVECWVYFNALPGDAVGAVFFHRGATASSNAEISVQLFNTAGVYTLRLQTSTSGAAWTSPLDSSAIAVSTGQWYHIAVCRQIPSTVYFWLNGAAVGTATNAESFFLGSGLTCIGANSLAAYPLNGYLDDIRITKDYCRYTTAFTPATAAFPEAMAAYTDTYFPQVVFLSHLDGGTAFDSSLKGIPILSATVTTVDSKFGGWSAGFGMSGGGPMVQLAFADLNGEFNFGTSAFTIEFWHNMLNIGGASFQGVLAIGEGGATYLPLSILRNNSGADLLVSKSNVARTANEFSSVVLTAAGGWCHYAVVYDGATTLKTYFNGVAGTPQTVSAAFASLIAGDYVRWQYNSGYGYTDEIRVTKGVARYTSTFTAPTVAFSTAYTGSASVSGGVAGISEAASAAIQDAPDTVAATVFVIIIPVMNAFIYEAPDVCGSVCNVRSLAICTADIHEAPDFVSLWADINTTQAGPWTPINPDAIAGWVDVNDNQPSMWTDVST